MIKRFTAQIAVCFIVAVCAILSEGQLIPWLIELNAFMKLVGNWRQLT